MRSALSADAVASHVGVATSTYREWENGRAISGQPYIKLAQVLGVSLHALFGLSDSRRDDVLVLFDQVEKLIEDLRKVI